MIYRTATRRGVRPIWLTYLRTALVLLALILVGLYFRTLNLRDWDNRQSLHPDERFIQYTVDSLRVPHSWHDYFNSDCVPPVPANAPPGTLPGTILNPRDPMQPTDKQEPSLASGCSTLNPRNYNNSRTFVYGTLPTTLVRVIAEATNQTDPGQLVVVGRILSTLADLLTVLIMFALGRRLYGRNVGLLAAGLYACAVMPIQQSHFFTTDNFGTTFVTLALLFAVRMAQTARWRDATLLGMFLGCSIACKVNLAALAVVAVGAALVIALGASRRRTRRSGARIYALEPLVERRTQRAPLRAALLLVLVGICTCAVFRVAQPDAFMGPQLWNIKPEPRFVDNIKQIRDFVDGTVDWPPSHQWANRTPFLFAWQNMVQWGMGVPLGLAAWLGWMAAGWLILRKHAWQHLVPWSWVALYWLWQGGGFNPTMRYFLPIYPPLVLFAAWGAQQLRQYSLRRWNTQQFRGAALRRSLAWTPALLLLLTFGWAWAFTRIYTRPHTRVAATAWINANVPVGATVTDEQWDDSVSGGTVALPIETHPYYEDEPSKYVGKTDGQNPEDGLITQLGKADYVALSSARVYGSVVRLPQRFPVTIRYYQALFDGSLGFDQVADFTSFPTIFGIPINDTNSDEAFTVYDHPRVLIFKRTDRFNPDAAQHLLFDKVVWSEIYRTSAKQTNAAPTMLRLTVQAWQTLTTQATTLAVDGPTGLVALLLWLLALEVLGLAAFATLWHFGVPLRERGLGLSRLLGLVVLAVPPGVLATHVPVGRTTWAAWYGLLVAFGLRLGFFHRRAIGAWLREHRRHVLFSQGVYGAGLLVGIVLRLAHPSFVTADEQLRLAQWTVLLRSNTLPPPDPLFAGGQLTVPYGALLPIAALAKLVGLPPAIALNFALATLLGLLALALWAVLARPIPAAQQRVQRPLAEEPQVAVPRLVVTSDDDLSNFDSGPAWRPDLAPSRRRPLGYGIAVLVAVMLVIMPGLFWGAAHTWSVLGAVLAADGATLGGLLLLAGALALGRAWLRRFEHAGWRRSLGLALLLMLTLTLLAGQSTAVFAVVGLLLTANTLLLRRDRLNAFVVQVSILLVAVGLAHGWSQSIAPGPTVPIALAPAALPLALVLPLVFALAYLLRSAARFVEPWLLGVVGGLVTVWGLAGWYVEHRLTDPALAASSRAAILFNSPLIFLPAAIALIWLLLATMWPDRERPYGHRGSSRTLLLLLGALGLVTLAHQVMQGKASGSPALLLNSAAVLLAIVGGQYLWLLARTRRSVAGPLLFGSALAAALLVVLTPVRTPELAQEPAAWHFANTPGTAMSHLIAKLAANERGLPLVVAADSPTTLPQTVIEGGYPTLLAAREHEAQLRSYLSPSLDQVMDGRDHALAAIYGIDPAQAQRVLATYHVDYVVLGEAERQRWGAQAGQALTSLVSSHVLTSTFTEGATTLYHAAPQTEAPPFVAVTPQLDVPGTKGMLNPPLAAQPQVGDLIRSPFGQRWPILAAWWEALFRVDDWAWNSLANSVQPVAVALWLLMIELLGLLVWPLTRRIFGGWYAAGWAWTKLIGLLLWGYVVWLILSFHLLVYNWMALVVGLVIVATLVVLVAGWRPRTRSQTLRQIWSTGLQQHGREILRSEALFIVAYLVWIGIRALNPDLWHPILGGEKPFEFGFLNAILRSPYMPPADPFFSGGAINYYYYGLFLVSLPIKATGIAPSIAFNLAVALLFALVAAGAAAVVHELTGRWRYGLLGTLFVTILGPVGSVIPIGSSKGLTFLLDALKPGLAGFAGRIGDWFWGPSRIIDTNASHTINEFPFFSYLFADLHPHMIVLPYTILAVALTLEVARRAGMYGQQHVQRRLALPLVLGALLIGTLAAANSWDAPTYALVLGGALVGGVWRVGRLRRQPWSLLWARLGIAVSQATAVLLGGLVLFSPFFLQYQAMVGGIGHVQVSDTIAQFLAVFGLSSFAGISFLVLVSSAVLRRVRVRYRRFAGPAAAVVSVLIGALLLSAATFPGAQAPINWG
ncbi:MAG: glycosyltransferase family 39 protein, partial [Herpetosiphonaceae bacterium]|nr:glycosyltransferase family 39 protein [Herpetosiphonaceae bacterium]